MSANSETFAASLRMHLETGIRDALLDRGVADTVDRPLLDEIAEREARNVVLTFLLQKGGNQLRVPKRNEDAGFLLQLREWTRTAFRAAFEVCGVPMGEAEAEEEARGVIQGLVAEWGGDIFNVPLKCEELDTAIYEDMRRGGSPSDLSARYRVAVSTIYKIYHSQRAKRSAPGQAALPGI